MHMLLKICFYLWFWNQILTWVGVSCIIEAKCSLSGADRYLCWRNLRSNSYVCALEKSTRRLRFLWTAPDRWPLPATSLSSSSRSSSLCSLLLVWWGGAESLVSDLSDIDGLVLSGLSCWWTPGNNVFVRGNRNVNLYWLKQKEN